MIAKQLGIALSIAALGAVSACAIDGTETDDSSCVGEQCITGGKGDSWTPEPPPLDNQGVPEQLLGEDQRLSPLYAMGDVNEDGRVNYADYKLLKNHVLYDASPKTMSCYAAADFDLNGTVDGDDLSLMFELTDGGDNLAALTLYSDPSLPCDHSNLLLAAKLDTQAGGEVPVRFVDGEHSVDVAEAWLTTENAELELAADGLGYVVRAATWAEPGDYIGLDVQLVSGTVFTLSIPLIATIVDDTPTTYEATTKTPSACPQRGKGCVAFMLDFSKHVWYEFDSDEIADALPGVGCTTTYVAPNFRRVPQVVLYKSRFYTVIFRPSATAVANARAHNRTQWTNIRNKWSTWRQSVGNQDMAMVMVNGHGSSTSWSAGFDTGDHLNRAQFHREFYAVAAGKVCSTVTHDMSCYAGHTPRLVKNLNNSGSTSATSTEDHSKHAGYDLDVATATSKWNKTTMNIEVGARVAEIGQVLKAARTAAGGVPTNHADLAQRFRTEAHVRVPVSYRDDGYATCGPGKHQNP